MTDRPRGRANRRIARGIANRDGWRCWRCGQTIDDALTYPDRGSLSIGHIVPRSQGGGDDPRNLAPEHLGCNLDAGAGLPHPAPVIVTP